MRKKLRNSWLFDVFLGVLALKKNVDLRTKICGLLKIADKKDADFWKVTNAVGDHDTFTYLKF